jgi:hypothetical protein
MAFVLALNGMDNLLNDLTIGTRVRLFKNDITPSASDGLGDYTEADFSGYSAVTVTQGSASVVSGKAQNVLSPSAVFSHDDGGTDNNIYGFYVTDATPSTLYYAERFSGAPIAMDDDGDSITVAVTFTLDQEP